MTHRAPNAIIVEQFKFDKKIFQFNAVSANILDRRGANAAWNQRHVLQAVQFVLETGLHQLMPIFARGHAH